MSTKNTAAAPPSPSSKRVRPKADPLLHGIWKPNKAMYEVAKKFAASKLQDGLLREGGLDDDVLRQIEAMRQPGVMEAMNARDTKYEANMANRVKSAQKKVEQRCIRTVVQWFNHINIDRDRYLPETPAVDADAEAELPSDAALRKYLQDFQELFLSTEDGDLRVAIAVLKLIHKETRPYAETVQRQLLKNSAARKAHRLKKAGQDGKLKRDREDEEPVLDQEDGDDDAAAPMEVEEEEEQVDEPEEEVVVKRPPPKKVARASPTKLVMKK